MEEYSTMIEQGKFITFDGIDGAGKTTQIERLADYLRQQGKTVYITREPGGTVLAEKIRNLLLDKENEMHSLTELLLMFASRAEHIEAILRPKIQAGEWIICSRFTDATMAYQGYARGQDLQKIQAIANVVHSDFNPDISFFLDLPAELAAQRRDTRGEDDDRFEAEAITFMQKVRNAYLNIAKQEPNRCKVIDATRNVDEMARQIRELI